MNLPSTFASASMNSPRSMTLSLSNHSPGYGGSMKKNVSLLSWASERLAVVLPQDAHVLQALGGLEVLLGVGRRAEVLLRRVRAVRAAVAGVGAHEDELVEARDVVLRRHVAGLGEALLRDGPLEAAAQLLDALGRHRLDAAVEEHHVVVEIGDDLLVARVLACSTAAAPAKGST